MIGLLLVTLIAAQEPPPTTDPSVDARLDALQALYDDVECGQLMARAPEVAALPLDGKQRTRLLFLEAACSVVLGNISDAAQNLEVLVRDDVNVEPPFPIEKRLTLLLNAARVEEEQRRAKEAEAARLERTASVRLKADVNLPITGGQRALFTATVTDPNALVASMRVEFRKKGAQEFYSLPLSRKDATTWTGEIPGRFTVTSQGMYLEWFVSASETDGTVLRTFGTSTAPNELFVKPGADVATDLRATERLPHLTRVAYAGFGASGVAAGAFVVTATAAPLLPIFLSLIPVPLIQGLATGLAVVVYAAGTAAAAVGTYAAVDLLTDEVWVKASVATYVALAGVSGLAIVSAAAASDIEVALGPVAILGVSGAALLAAAFSLPIGALPATAILLEDDGGFE